MRTSFWAAVLAVTMVAAAPGAAAINAGVQIVGPLEAESEVVASNAFSAFLGGGLPWIDGLESASIIGDFDGSNNNAAANCQFNLAVNTFVWSLVAADMLAVIDDDDDVTLPGLILRPIEAGFATQGMRGSPYGQTVSNGTASCETHVGPIDVLLDVPDGWGEPAPQGDGLMAAAEALSNGDGIGGLDGGLNIALNLAFGASASTGVVASNVADVFLTGTGNSVSNCQTNIVWNTAVLSTALLKMKTKVSDEDVIAPPERPENGDGATLASVDGNGLKYGAGNVTSSSGTSSCLQKIESITLRTDDRDKTDYVPPSS